MVRQNAGIILWSKESNGEDILSEQAEVFEAKEEVENVECFSMINKTKFTALDAR